MRSKIKQKEHQLFLNDLGKYNTETIFPIGVNLIFKMRQINLFKSAGYLKLLNTFKIFLKNVL